MSPMVHMGWVPCFSYTFCCVRRWRVSLTTGMATPNSKQVLADGLQRSQTAMSMFQTYIDLHHGGDFVEVGIVGLIVTGVRLCRDLNQRSRVPLTFSALCFATSRATSGLHICSFDVPRI